MALVIGNAFDNEVIIYETPRYLLFMYKTNIPEKDCNFKML